MFFLDFFFIFIIDYVALVQQRDNALGSVRLSVCLSVFKAELSSKDLLAVVKQLFNLERFSSHCSTLDFSGL